MSVTEFPSRPPATLPPDRYLTRDELADLWKVSVSTIDRMHKRDGMPSEPFGARVVRFRLGDVEAWRKRRAA